MKKFLLVICSLIVAAPGLLAQSSSEINAAKALARSYGYSSDEIDNAVNGYSGNGSVNDKNVGSARGGQSNRTLSTAASTVAYPPVSDIGIGMDEVPTPMTIKPIEGRKAPSSNVYGHDFFISDGLALIPSINAPIPASYRLGPGDDVTIEIWGDSNTSISRVIGNDGTISIQNVGPVTISGMTVAEAEKFLKSKLAVRYSALRSGGASLQLSVNKIRGVTVYVLGEVTTPGVYTLPSLSSIATAVYMAGGIMTNGSVRNIGLYRNSQLAGTFDLYEYIFKGKYDTNIKLQDGDIISVGGIDGIVKVGGGLNRNELKFELKRGETVADLISYAGGFSTDAYRDMVHVDRFDGPLGKSFDVQAADFGTFELRRGDSLYVNVNIPKITNRVYVTGAVLHPGPYAISDKLANVRQLIEAAGGLQEGTYSNRGFICRRDADMKPVNLSFNLGRIMDGTDNIDLVRDDSVRVYTVLELQDSLTVTVNGEVNAPGNFDYRAGMTVGDVILMAGGLTDGGDISNVEIASRGRDSLATVRHLNLIENPESKGELLYPFDIVFIRTKVNYRELQTVTVKGEVKYPGTYAIEKNSVRLSDVIARAGGFTEDAYVKGARLKRLMTDEEVEKARMAALSQNDSIMANYYAIDTLPDIEPQYVVDPETGLVDSTQIIVPADTDLEKMQKSKKQKQNQKTYYIGIDLAKAVKNPGTYDDIILRSDDEIEVPQMNNTVKISGGVYFPNTVAYNPSLSWRDYINQAGGFVRGARKHKTYVIYMDGSSAVRGSSKFKMEPGMEIVVPKSKGDDGEKLSLAEVASLTSSFSSMAYMAAILLNMFK